MVSDLGNLIKMKGPSTMGPLLFNSDQISWIDSIQIRHDSLEQYIRMWKGGKKREIDNLALTLFESTKKT